MKSNRFRLCFVAVFLSLLTVSCGLLPTERSLPATGQTEWYQNNGEVASCIDFEGFDGLADVPPAQDGFIMSGCPMNGRFEINGSVVEDNCTNLVWQRVPRNERFNWSEALVFARDATLGGFEDWRVPNVHELLSLVHYGRTSPALHPTFDFSPDGGDDVINITNNESYWSSTSVNDFALRTHAWQVNFINGSHDFVEKSQRLAMRLVRGGSIPSRAPVLACEIVVSP